MYLRARSLAAMFVLAVAAMIMSPVARAQEDECNEYHSIPEDGYNCETIIIPLDDLCKLDLSATATDPGVNPFVKKGGTSCVKVIPDEANRTAQIKTCSEDTRVEHDDRFQYDANNPGRGMPHTGLIGTGLPGSATTFLSNEPDPCGGPGDGFVQACVRNNNTASSNVHSAPTRGLASNGTLASKAQHATLHVKPVALRNGAPAPSTDPPTSFTPSPFLTLTGSSPDPLVTPAYYILFVEGRAPDGSIIGTWFQRKYDSAAGTPGFQIKNDTSLDITITNIGFLLGEPFHPLRELNWGGDGNRLNPPGDLHGSAFRRPDPPLPSNVIPANGGSIPAPVQ